MGPTPVLRCCVFLHVLNKRVTIAAYLLTPSSLLGIYLYICVCALLIFILSQMSRKRTYSPVYERAPKRTRFVSSERLVTPEESARRGLLPDVKVSQ